MDRNTLATEVHNPMLEPTGSDKRASSTESSSGALSYSLGGQPFSPIFTVAARTPLLLLGVFSMATLGCAQAGMWTDGRDSEDASSISSLESTQPSDAAERADEVERMDGRSRAESFQSSESEPSGGAAPLSAQASEGLVDALAATYAADMAALAEMQRARRAAADDVIATQSERAPETVRTPSIRVSPQVSAPVAAFASPPSSSDSMAQQFAKPLVRTTPVPAVRKTTPPAATTPPTPAPTMPTTESGATSSASTAAPAPTAAAPAPTQAETTHAVPSPSATTPAGDTPSPAHSSTDPSAVPTVATARTPAPAPITPPAEPSITAVNGALELPPPPAPIPTTPGELAKLLAQSLAKQSAASSAPMREWLGFAALAVTDPTLELPADFGSDLLPAERERVIKAHAGFVALGTALSQGAEHIDRTVADRLLLALTGGPKLSIPKVDLCTRVEGFGRYTPLGNNKFLARSGTRFIVYTELDGFTSDLSEGSFVTRLATRVSIQSERDGIDVWQRSPEWTAVVDTSGVRRDNFFLCEIIPLSEYLSVGSYRLTVEVRDETTGAVATSTLPIHVVADPAMVAATE